MTPVLFGHAERSIAGFEDDEGIGTRKSARHPEPLASDFAKNEPVKGVCRYQSDGRTGSFRLAHLLTIAEPTRRTPSPVYRAASLVRIHTCCFTFVRLRTKQACVVFPRERLGMIAAERHC
jgi:hypothetical protein